MAHTFRELIQPGTNIEFVGRSRKFFTISIVAVLASIGMLFVNPLLPGRGSMLNWSIDFKGGTEVIVAVDKAVGASEVRGALAAAGFKDSEPSSYTFTEGGQKREGFLIRLPEFGAVAGAEADRIADQLVEKFKDRKVQKAKWSGDVLFVRSGAPITEAEYAEFFKGVGLEMRPFTDEQKLEASTAQPGTSEYQVQVAIFGLDRKVQNALAGKLGAKVEIKQVDAVGAKAGAELRNDGIMSLLYAIALIMLYIAFRFDFRYGPGTVASLVHDAILLIGVFAVFYVEFSLTTVAAVLTVIGYSMNDTVVVFDRIRENESRLKDKKLDRVINISINETLSRTLLTSVTTFVVTLAMNLLGTGLVKNFAFAMNVGILVGTYSSIFIAAPTLLWLHEHYFSKRPVSERRRGAAEPA